MRLRTKLLTTNADENTTDEVDKYLATTLQTKYTRLYCKTVPFAVSIFFSKFEWTQQQLKRLTDEHLNSLPKVSPKSKVIPKDRYT